MSSNNHNSNDFNNFTNIINGLTSPGTFNDFQNDEYVVGNQSSHQQQEDSSRYQVFDQQTFEEDNNNSGTHVHDNASDDSYEMEEHPGMSDEALAKLRQSRQDMKVRRGRKIKYENSICLECEENNHKSQGGIWCYELDHHKNNKRAPKYVNCDECHKLVSGPKYTRHLNKCAPSGASTTQSTTSTNITSNTVAQTQNISQGLNNVLPLSGAIVSLAYDGAAISNNTKQENRNDTQSNGSITINNQQNNQQSKPRVILGNPSQFNQNNMMPNNNVMNVPNNVGAPTFVIMPNPASNPSNNNASFLQQYQAANMLNMINGMNLQQVSSMSQAPLSPKSNNSSNSIPTIVIPQQNNSALQQQQLFNVMNRLSPQNNYPTSPKQQLVQIAPGTFGMQPMGSQNVGYPFNTNPNQQSQQQIIITNTNNRSTSPGGRVLDPNQAHQTRGMNAISPSLLVSAPISPNQQQNQQPQQYTKIIIPNNPNSPLQPQQQGNIFQPYIEPQPQTSYLSASSFSNNVSPSYSQQLSPNQQGWQSFQDGSPSLSPGGTSSTQNSQKKRKRGGSNAGSNQGASASESDFVEIRDDLIKKLSEENDEGVYSLRLYNETTRQYTVLMSTIHKPVKQLCSSKKRKKLNQILAPVLSKFGVDAETLIQIKEVRALIKSNRKPSSYANANNDNDSDSSEDRNNQPAVSQVNPSQITGSMMGILNEIPIINEPTNDYNNYYRQKESEDETQLDFGIMQGSFLQSLNDPNSHN
ncbi:predicted protein [Naegleria gruberi]|uniref:Predicted protein n=1 Tax=Naegleria gruberi TaxID=5762 RepID=D2VXH0_NAEGR|nr:uncharacterized protein NAEGRDRAFT_59502 [Naegleria gruberi]EFC38505.1 predicted protein [Naegleria gruberi]|eukprot:XP_002671249.1 predicted protein [Naegleria gruberi strain NEG-M]